MSSLIMAPTAKMEAVRRSRTKSFIILLHCFHCFSMQVSVRLLYRFPKLPLASCFSFSTGGLMDGWMDWKMDESQMVNGRRTS